MYKERTFKTTRTYQEKTKADLAGFEPAICSLGDCRPIQARLQAQLFDIINWIHKSLSLTMIKEEVLQVDEKSIGLDDRCP